MSGRSTTHTFVGVDKFSDVADKVAKKAGGMGGKIGKAGKALAVGFAAAAGAVAVAAPLIMKATSDASDLQETISKSQVVFGKAAKGVQAWGETAADSLGMSKNAAIAAASDFAVLGRSAGKSGKDLAGFSTDMVGLAADFASFHNASPEEAIAAIGSGLRGESEPLRKFGVLLNDATLKARAMKMGLIENTTEALTPQNKALAAQAEIMAQSKIAQGDFARTSDGLANTQRRLSATFEDLSAEAGKGFLPIAEKIAAWVLNTAIPAFKEFAGKVMPKLRDVFDTVKKAIDDNRPGLEKLGGMFVMYGQVIATKVAPAFLKVAGFIGKVLVAALAKLGDILPPIVSAYLKGVANLVGAFRGFYSAVTWVLEGILTVAEKTMGWIPGIGDKIKTAKEGFANFRTDTVAKLGAVQTGLRNAAGEVDAFAAKSRALPATKVRAEISDLQGKLATAKQELSNPDLTKDRKAAIKADIEDLKEKIGAAKAKLAEVQSKNVRIGVDLNFTKSGNPTVRLPSGRVVPLAKGGIVKRRPGGVIAQIGEGRYDEAVIPLRPGMSAPSGGGDIHIHINGGLDSSEAIARRVQTALLDLKRRQGVSLGLA